MLDRTWLDYYQRTAAERGDPISQSDYVLDGAPIEPGIFDRWMELIQRHMPVGREDRCLDVGCGSGLFLTRLARLCDHLYGVDPSPNQLALSARQCPTARLRIGTAIDAGFSNVRFDRIICVSVFHYFKTLDAARDAIQHFLGLGSERLAIWIGDLPLPSAGMDPVTCRRVGRTTGLETQHYPPEYMESVSTELGVKGRYVQQNVEGKVTASFRYDWLIERE